MFLRPKHNKVKTTQAISKTTDDPINHVYDIEDVQQSIAAPITTLFTATTTAVCRSGVIPCAATPLPHATIAAVCVF